MNAGRLIQVGIGCLSLVVSLSSAQPLSNWGQRKAVTLETLRQNFVQPDMIYAPFVFWFWDQPLDPAKAADMAREIAAQRFNPGYTHARMNMVGLPDLPREQWLSPVWFEAFGKALMEAQKAGTYLGFVDEYWWPSFRAADRVLKENPDLYARSLQCHTLDCTAGKTVEIGPSFFTVAARVEKFLPPVAEPPIKMDSQNQPEPQSINRPKPHQPAIIQSQTLRLIGSGNAFTWQLPAEGNWRVYRFTQYYHPGADGGRLNYLDERVAPAFHRLALEPYAQQFGDRLGHSIPGAFVDNEGSYGYKIAWSETLDHHYREKFARDIRLWMPLLLDEDDEGVYAKARWEWFDAVSDVYSQTLGSTSRWLDARGMYCISNLWEETLMWQAAAVGDFFKAQRGYSMPGTDCLALNALDPHDFMETRSVTDFENRRFMSEIMGAAGFWGYNPITIKQVANSITTWGVSHVVAHGIFMTRKLDGNPWLPDWFDGNPFWPWMNQWTDFVRRASYINSHGHIAADVLLVNPMDSVWVLSGPGMFDPAFPDRVPVPAVMDLPDKSIADFANEELKRQSSWWCPPRMDEWFSEQVHKINAAYSQAMTDLTSGRIEYLVADRHYLRKLNQQSGMLVAGDHGFHAVVLPPMVVLPVDVAEKIVGFARAGGRVFSLGELPSGSTDNGMNDPKIKTLMNELAGLPGFQNCPKGLKSIIEKKPEGLFSTVQFESGGFGMLMQHRRIDGRDFFWLANNTGQPHNSKLRLYRWGSVSLWDCETGQIRPIESQQTNSGLLVDLKFGPYDGFWLVVDLKEKSNSKNQKAKLQTINQNEQDAFLRLDGPWTIRIDPTTQPKLEHPVDLSVWVRERTEPILQDWGQWGLGKFSGLMDYETEFTMPNNVRINKKGTGTTSEHDELGSENIPVPLFVLDLGKVRHCAEVWVNGQSCGKRLWPPFEFDITSAVKPGPNRVRVRVGNLINNSYGQSAESGLFGPVVLRSNIK
ncbi:MAG: hypothetical protein GX455_00680 [Phycisphaerae bacterium]|nr:hypothetical protein [Phycisphaerae bacterium]